MLVESNNIIPITKLQRELTKKVRELAVSGNPLYITKNNNLEAVMVSFEDYVFFHNLEDIFEKLEIKEVIDKRLKNYKPERNVSWNKVREDI